MKTAFLLLLAFSRVAAAQEAAMIWSCDANARALVIRYTMDNEQWPKTPRPFIVSTLLDVDDDGVHTKVRRIRSKTFRCRLKHDRFEIKVTPGVPNMNLQGRCGMAITAIVTVTRNGVVVINERWLENADCFARERYIDRITFRDGVSEPEIHESSYTK